MLRELGVPDSVTYVTKDLERAVSEPAQDELAEITTSEPGRPVLRVLRGGRTDAPERLDTPALIAQIRASAAASEQRLRALREELRSRQAADALGGDE
jgi:hypothetical protein